MRWLVTGGRDFCDVPRQWRWFDALHLKFPCRHLIDGASDDVTGPYVGWDYWAHQWALAREIPTTRVHADWKALGRKAGPIRNRRMATECSPDVVVAGPGGRGTQGMIDIADELNIRVIRT